MLLYELDKIELEILEQLESEDGIDQEIYEQLKSAEEEQIIKCAKIFRQMQSDVKVCKDEINRLELRKVRLENNAQKLREIMFEGMKITGLNKIHNSYFDISIKKNPPSLRIHDEENIPEEFFKQSAPILDKQALREAIKNGAKIAGAELIQTERVDIK